MDGTGCSPTLGSSMILAAVKVLSKTKLLDSSFFTWLDEALERSSKYLASLFASPKDAADSMECTFVSCKSKPCNVGKSALFVAPGSPVHLGQYSCLQGGDKSRKTSLVRL